MGVTSQLAEFCANIKLAALPPEVVTRARFLVLDLVGNIVRARHDAESTASFVATVRSLGMATGNAGVFGDAARYSPVGAAFLNGALAHSLDFDDTHAAGSLHPGAPVIPAALAAGEMAGASGADVLAAIIAGYEVTCRVALALPAGEHYDRGFHPTATCGAFGAAAAAARVFGLDADGVAGAMGTVLSQTAGSLQFLANGAWTKRSQVGWAAVNGLTGRDPGARGLQRRLRSARGQAWLHARLRAEPETRARRARPRHRVRVDEHCGETLSVVPLWPCRHRRGVGVACGERFATRRHYLDPSGLAAFRHAVDRRAGGEKGQSGECGRWPVQRPVRRSRPRWRPGRWAGTAISY